MVANTNVVEFLRFGSSIPGGYWGCCAGDVIQAFKTMPDHPNSCQSVNGDSGHPEMHDDGGFAYFGPTNLDLFLQRLRVGTFGGGGMPNHFFFVVLEQSQIDGEIGKAWLPILKREGFEFIRKVNNSVWNKNNYIFGLIRNCGANAVADQFTPPKAWRDLPSNGKKELWEFINDTKALTAQYKGVDKALYDKLPKKLLSEAEIVKAGAPVILAALRTENPQEKKEVREARQKQQNKKQEGSLRVAAIADVCAPVKG